MLLIRLNSIDNQHIARYNHQDNGGACLIHKHSDLAPGHLLVMTFENDKSFTRPTPVLAAQVVPHTVCLYLLFVPCLFFFAFSFFLFQ